jgi:hypothetical protein
VTEIVQTCVNHPDTETRISCSSCGDPICTRCMHTAAVGQKCPRCARTPRSARALGKPQHYVRAIGGGLLVAIAGGLLYGQVARAIGFGLLILAGVLGYVIGRVVKWGTRGQSQQPFQVIAMTLAGVAVLVGFVTAFGSLVPGIFAVLAYAVAIWLAARGIHS